MVSSHPSGHPNTSKPRQADASGVVEPKDVTADEAQARKDLILSLDSHSDVPLIETIPIDDMLLWKAMRSDARDAVKELHGLGTIRALKDIWQAHHHSYISLLLNIIKGKNRFHWSPPFKLVAQDALMDTDTPLHLYFSLIPPDKWQDLFAEIKALVGDEGPKNVLAEKREVETKRIAEEARVAEHAKFERIRKQEERARIAEERKRLLAEGKRRKAAEAKKKRRATEPKPPPEPAPIPDPYPSESANTKQREFTVLLATAVEEVPQINSLPDNDLEKWIGIRREALDRMKKFIGIKEDEQLFEYLQQGSEASLLYLLEPSDDSLGLKGAFEPKHLIEIALDDFKTPLWMFMSLVEPERRTEFLLLLREELYDPERRQEIRSCQAAHSIPGKDQLLKLDAIRVKEALPVKMQMFAGDLSQGGIAQRFGKSDGYLSQATQADKYINPKILIVFAINDTKTELWEFFAAVHPQNREGFLELLKEAIENEEAAAAELTVTKPKIGNSATTNSVRSQRELLIRALGSHYQIPNIGGIPANDIAEWARIRKSTLEMMRKHLGFGRIEDLVPYFGKSDERSGEPNLNLRRIFSVSLGERTFFDGVKPDLLVDIALADTETPLWMYFSLVQSEDREPFLRKLKAKVEKNQSSPKRA